MSRLCILKTTPKAGKNVAYLFLFKCHPVLIFSLIKHLEANNLKGCLLRYFPTLSALKPIGAVYECPLVAHVVVTQIKQTYYKASILKK